MQFNLDQPLDTVLEHNNLMMFFVLGFQGQTSLDGS